MRFVQIGILGLLAVIAALLGGIYSEQRAQRVAEEPAEAQPEPLFTAAPEEEVLVGAPAEDVAEPIPEPVSEVTKPRPARRRTYEPPATGPRTAPADTTLGQMAPQIAVAPPVAEVDAAAVNGVPETIERMPRRATIPEGTLLRVRLDHAIATNRNREGEPFTATLGEELVIDGMVLAESGARVEGVIAYLRRSQRLEGRASLELELTRLYTSDGQEVDIFTRRESREAESTAGKDARNISIGAAIGAAIGAIAGGGKGAAIGAAAGAGAGAGGTAVTRGRPARYEVEEAVVFELAAPVTLIEQI